jgi:hypothetical protein
VEPELRRADAVARALVDDELGAAAGDALRGAGGRQPGQRRLDLLLRLLDRGRLLRRRARRRLVAQVRSRAPARRWATGAGTVTVCVCVPGAPERSTLNV